MTLSGLDLKHKRYKVDTARNGPQIIDRAPILKAVDYAVKAGIRKAEIAARIGSTYDAFRHVSNRESTKIYRRNADAILTALEELVRERREALTDLQSSIVWAKTKQKCAGGK